MKRKETFIGFSDKSSGGRILLNYAKDKRNKLYLNVYQKNARAISFYKREGNIVNKERCICYARYTRVEDDENLNRGIYFHLKNRMMSITVNEIKASRDEH